MPRSNAAFMSLAADVSRLMIWCRWRPISPPAHISAHKSTLEALSFHRGITLVVGRAGPSNTSGSVIRNGGKEVVQDAIPRTDVHNKVRIAMYLPPLIMSMAPTSCYRLPSAPFNRTNQSFASILSVAAADCFSQKRIFRKSTLIFALLAAVLAATTFRT